MNGIEDKKRKIQTHQERTPNHISTRPNSSDKATSQTGSDDHINYTTWKRKGSGTPHPQKTNRSGHWNEGPKQSHSPFPVVPLENAENHSQCQSTIYSSVMHKMTTWKHAVDETVLLLCRRSGRYHNCRQYPPKKKWNNSYRPHSSQQEYCNHSLIDDK